MRKFILILLIILIFTLPIVYAEDCQVSKIKTNLKKALYEYYNSPQAARLELGNIKDLLNFYLGIQPGQSVVNCDGIGQYSGEVFSRIIQDANNITTTIPKCSDGTEFGECAVSQPKYCYNGELVNKCSVCGCASGVCKVDESCGTGTNTTPTCTNECTSGQLYCSGSYARTCGNYDADSCLEWNTGSLCANGCMNGICNASPSNQTNQTSCTDSDGGLNYFTIGTVNGPGGPMIDVCFTTDGLSEFYCQNGNIAGVVYQCPNGCTNGVCNAQSNQTIGNEIRVSNRDSVKRSPDIYGNKIVWQDASLVGFTNNFPYYQSWDIFSYDLATNQEKQLTTNNKSQILPSIYGNNVVWEDYRNFVSTANYNSDIFKYDLSTGTEVSIINNSLGQFAPDIYENKIVWDDKRNGNWDIYLYDLITNQERSITLNLYREGGQQIYENNIIWIKNVNPRNYFLYDLNTEQEIQISQSSGGSLSLPAIYEDKVFWFEYTPDTSYYFYLYDLTLKQKSLIKQFTGCGYDASVSMYGNKVVWSDCRNGNYDLFMYNLDTQQETQITSNTANQVMPVIYGNKVVWQDNRDGHDEIYMTTIS